MKVSDEFSSFLTLVSCRGLAAALSCGIRCLGDPERGWSVFSDPLSEKGAACGGLYRQPQRRFVWCSSELSSRLLEKPLHQRSALQMLLAGT